VAIQPSFGRSAFALTVATVVEGEYVDTEAPQASVVLGPPAVADVSGVSVEDQNPGRRRVVAHEPTDEAHTVGRHCGDPGRAEARVRWRQPARPGGDRKHQPIFSPGQQTHEASVPKQPDNQHCPDSAANLELHSGWNRSPFAAISCNTGAGAKRAPYSACR